MNKIKLENAANDSIGRVFLPAVRAIVLLEKYGEEVRSVPKSEFAMLDQLLRCYKFASDYYARERTEGPAVQKAQ